jgi:hypothetical protein
MINTLETSPLRHPWQASRYPLHYLPRIRQRSTDLFEIPYIRLLSAWSPLMSTSSERKAEIQHYNRKYE